MLKKSLIWFGLGIGGLLLLIGLFALFVELDGLPHYLRSVPARAVESTPERVARGRKLVSTLCVGCHLSPDTGKLTGKHMADLPPEFGVIFSKNITRSKAHGIGAWSDADLAYLLRTGVGPDGRYVPPYMVKLPHLSDEDLDSILAFLRSDDALVAATEIDPPGVTAPSFLVKVLSHTVMRPLPLPEGIKTAPPISDEVAYGRYLVYSLDCFSCHSADFKSVNIMDPPSSVGFLAGGNKLLALDGSGIWSANITLDEATGIGRMSRADFVRTLRNGIRPDGYALKYPMVPPSALDDAEIAAIYAYLRTVPKVHHAVPRPSQNDLGDDPGKRAYTRYGCASCHGDAGFGIGDLRSANRDYPSDPDLLHWILDAPTIKPGTRMPAWRDIVAERDYAALLAHVRKLSSNADKSAGSTSNR